MGDDAQSQAMANGSSARGTQMRGGSSIQVVEFLLGKEHFAIDLFDVKEVVEYSRITTLPNSPQFIKGIIDLRGEITTIIDLKTKLNIVQTGSTEEQNSRIIVLDDTITKSKTGIMVDDVLAVSTFSREDVDNTTMTEQTRGHILGIIKKKTRIRDKDITELVIWIDIRGILGTLTEE